MTPIHAIIGIDGGGSNTRAAAVATDGTLIGEGVAAGSNPNNEGFESAASNILQAMAETGADLSSVDALCLGIAGLGDEALIAQLKSALLAKEPRLASAKLLLTHDLEIAHFSVFGSGSGVVLLAGTGSACFAKRSDGERFRASGRDYKYEDPGSGYAIGKRAIETGLLARQGSRQTIAALAPQVVALATEGDLKALNILRVESEHLVKLARPIIEAVREKDQQPSLALFGGIIEADTVYRSSVLFDLHRAFPLLELVEGQSAPLLGALKIAWQLARSDPFPELALCKATR